MLIRLGCSIGTPRFYIHVQPNGPGLRVTKLFNPCVNHNSVKKGLRKMVEKSLAAVKEAETDEMSVKKVSYRASVKGR
jgi:hypothetical protein